MEKPFLYSIFYSENSKILFKQTNNQETAVKIAGKKNGTIYFDTRYSAKLRLYRYILSKNNP